jgi:exodeoxyribonuclease-3
MEKLPGIQRVATLNIRHGGKKHEGALNSRLLGYDADLLIVTEFRANDVGERLIGQLHRAGYETSHPGSAPDRNAVLVASRRSIARSWALDETLDAERLWCVDIGGTVICGVLFPNKEEKQPYWHSVIAAARRGGVDLFIGDFNTGNNALDKDPKGAPFINADMPRRLVGCGYVDVWRSRHPGVREYTWYSQTKNGFRLDHAFAVPTLAGRVTDCAFDHEPRLLGETDHSALVFSVSSDGVDSNAR